MCFLHFYWFSIFIQMIKVAVTTGKAEDLQNKVSDKKYGEKVSIKKTN